MMQKTILSRVPQGEPLETGDVLFAFGRKFVMNYHTYLDRWISDDKLLRLEAQLAAALHEDGLFYRYKALYGDDVLFADGHCVVTASGDIYGPGKDRLDVFLPDSVLATAKRYANLVSAVGLACLNQRYEEYVAAGHLVPLTDVDDYYENFMNFWHWWREQ